MDESHPGSSNIRPRSWDCVAYDSGPPPRSRAGTPEEKLIAQDPRLANLDCEEIDRKCEMMSWHSCPVSVARGITQSMHQSKNIKSNKIRILRFVPVKLIKD